ncbi:MAG TPA: hypothetical protein VGO00_11575 [Kofleriaceae bacterium]|nr:hypothetical protein [Kofleriaceae bacterium]
MIGVPLAAADDYPTPLIERPMSLNPSTFQLTAAYEYLGVLSGDDSGGIGSLVFAGDYTLFPKLQVGAIAVVDVTPESRFGAALLNGQYEFLKFAAIRADIGITNGANTNGSFGVGLPIRLKLTDMFAFISGRPYAYGAEDDILIAGVGTGSATLFQIPLGLLIQLTPHISVAARSGFREVSSAEFVPVGIDATIESSRVDFGVMFDFGGQIAPSEAPGFFHTQQFRLWAQLRI